MAKSLVSCFFDSRCRGRSIFGGGGNRTPQIQTLEILEPLIESPRMLARDPQRDSPQSM